MKLSVNVYEFAVIFFVGVLCGSLFGFFLTVFLWVSISVILYLWDKLQEAKKAQEPVTV